MKLIKKFIQNMFFVCYFWNFVLHKTFQNVFIFDSNVSVWVGTRVNFPTRLGLLHLKLTIWYSFTGIQNRPGLRRLVFAQDSYTISRFFTQFQPIERPKMVCFFILETLIFNTITVGFIFTSIQLPEWTKNILPPPLRIQVSLDNKQFQHILITEISKPLEISNLLEISIQNKICKLIFTLWIFLHLQNTIYNGHPYIQPS